MRKKSGEHLLELCKISLGAVLITICAWITIPFAIPFTMQTFGVFSVCVLLGGRSGSVCVLLYLLLGAIGIPVFSGFGAGFGVLLGATGGFLWGFLFSSLAFWTITHFFGEKAVSTAVALIGGLLVCYALGTAWYAVVYVKDASLAGFASAAATCVLPFILPDLAKAALAFFVANRVKKYIV